MHLAEFALASRTLTHLAEGDRVIYAFSTDSSRERRVVLITSSTTPATCSRSSRARAAPRCGS